MDDTVELVLVEGAIREDENKYTNYVGWLIEEELTIWFSSILKKILILS